MKVILLPYRAYMLIIGLAMLVAGSKVGDDILMECGISKEKDATLQKCLADYMDQIEEVLVNIENPAIKQLFRKSMKCFPEEKTEEKSCYGKVMKAKYLQMKRNRHRDFYYGAGDIYFDYLRYTEALLKPCKVDRNTTPLFFACLDLLNPEAQKIMKSEKNNGRQAFESMAVLISSAKSCYNDFTPQQGQCLVEQTMILKKNITYIMEMQGKETAEKMKSCGFSAEAIATGMACTKPKADKIIELSFQIFEKPEYAKQTWDLLGAMKTCVTKYTEVKNCLMPGSD